MLSFSSDGNLGGSTGAVTLAGGTLRFSGTNASTARAITTGTGGGTIDVTSSSATLTHTGTLSGTGGLTKTGSGTLELKNVRLPSVTVSAATLKITTNGGSDGASKVSSLTIGASAKLDLSDNDLVVDAVDDTQALSFLETIEGYIASARNTSPTKWQGNGLTSSAAAANSITGLAAIRNVNGSTTVRADLSGQSADMSSVLIKYTYEGDGTLDGRINADDYFLIDSGFLAQPSNPNYRDGDFNYDNQVNADDYFLIDSAYLGQGAQLSASGPVSATAAAPAVAVPEPAVLGVVGVVVASLVNARRRRRPNAA